MGNFVSDNGNWLDLLPPISRQGTYQQHRTPISSVLSALSLQTKPRYNKCQGTSEHLFILWEGFVVVNIAFDKWAAPLAAEDCLLAQREFRCSGYLSASSRHHPTPTHDSHGSFLYCTMLCPRHLLSCLQQQKCQADVGHSFLRTACTRPALRYYPDLLSAVVWIENDS